MDTNAWVITIVVAVLIALLLYYIISVYKKTIKPLQVNKILKFTTDADLPDEPAEVAVCAQCGMRNGEGGETLARIDWQENTQILLSAEAIQIPEGLPAAV